MATNPELKQIVITPQIYIPLQRQPSDSSQEPSQPIRTEIPTAWIQDGTDFRLDISLPGSSALEILFPLQIESLHVNGETVWEKTALHPASVEGIQAVLFPDGLRLTCASGGAFHILASGLLK